MIPTFGYNDQLFSAYNVIKIMSTKISLLIISCINYNSNSMYIFIIYSSNSMCEPDRERL